MKDRKQLLVLPVITFLLGLAGPMATAAAKTDILTTKPSSPHRKWLDEEVVYIISPTERKVFLQLQSDPERDRFVEAFWKHRDPTPGTPENEFKDEHYKRLSRANYVYGRSAPMPGWRTDRGRIFIILGEPMSVVHYDNNPELKPCEVWYYQGLSHLGLPEGLQLVFFQEGAGDFRLYRPAQDGPMALILAWRGRESPTDYETAYERISQIEFNLASPSLSVDPADTTSTNTGRPSTSSDLVMNKVADTPWKRIEDGYARKFLEYKDRVEVEYSTNWVPSSGQLFTQPGDTGIAWVHYAIELKNLTLDVYEKKFFTALKVSGSVTTPEGRIVHQFDKTASLNLSEAQLQEARSQPFVFRDLFPLIPGRFQLTVLVKNETSKEFTSREKAIDIPEPTSRPRIASLLLGYRSVAAAAAGGQVMPFQFGPYQISTQPGRLFVRKDTLAAAFRVLGLSDAQRAGAVIHWTMVREGRPFMEKRRPLGEYPAFPFCLESISLAPLDPAYYTFRLTLELEGRETALVDEEFVVSPQVELPRPWFYSRSQPVESDPQFIQVVGSQFFQAGKLDPARSWLERAFRLNPASAETALILAQVYLAAGENGRVTQLLAPFMADERKATYEMSLACGQAWQQEGEFAKAEEAYSRAVSRFGVNTTLLNALGACYLGLKRPGEALAAWEKSLQFEPRQEEIRRKIDALKAQK
jgi:GWxTD domain-containing protein